VYISKKKKRSSSSKRGGAPTPCLETPPNKIYQNFVAQLNNTSARYTTSHIISMVGSVKGYSGSNNTTFVTTLAPYCSEPAGTKVLVRRSKYAFANNKKTQINQSAFFAMKMSGAGIGPKIYDIQYTSDARVVYVMEAFDMDLKTYMTENIRHTEDLYTMVARSLADQTTHILTTMVRLKILCSDIKPENTVVRIDPVTNMPSLRFIDVDADYCSPIDHKTAPEHILMNAPASIQMYMSYLFANHLYTSELNFLAETNRTYRSAIPELIQVIQSNQQMFSSVMFNYFKHDDINTFINHACEFSHHFKTEEEALEYSEKIAQIKAARATARVGAEEVAARWEEEKIRRATVVAAAAPTTNAAVIVTPAAAPTTNAAVIVTPAAAPTITPHSDSNPGTRNTRNSTHITNSHRALSAIPTPVFNPSLVHMANTAPPVLEHEEAGEAGEANEEATYYDSDETYEDGEGWGRGM
jgi:hypothetical protein